MRVIITGGTGLIGSALTKRLLDRGEDVILLSRNPQAYQDQAPAGARLESWDGRSAAGWGHLVNSETAIVNLAGENLSAGPWTNARKRRIIDSRVNAGLAVSEAIQEADQKPLVLIQSSAVGFYGPLGDQIVDESQEPGDDFLSQVCLDWEASSAPVEKLGVRRVIIRTGVVLSMQDGALPKMLLPFRLFVGGPIGSGKQGFPWIHIEDEAAAIEFLIDHPQAKGIYNLAAPQAVNNRQFGKALGKIIKRPAVFPLPAFALRLALGEMSTVLLDGQLVKPQRLLDLGYAFRFPNLEGALQDLLKQ